MNMPDEFVIEVTAEDIDRGMKRECMWCPVAFAARRALGWPPDPSGGLEVITTEFGHAVSIAGGPKWALPREASDFIQTFDSGILTGPITFTATVYPEAMT